MLLRNSYLSASIVHFFNKIKTNNLLFMSLLRKKSLSHLLASAEDSGKGLKRTLGAGNLVALGIGAIIGAGLFVRTAAASAEAAGPAVTI